MTIFFSYFFLLSIFALTIKLFLKISSLSKDVKDLRSLMLKALSQDQHNNAAVSLEKRLEALQKAKFSVDMSIPLKGKNYGRKE